MSVEGRVKKFRPGDEILSYCGRCRQERTHQIIALNGVGRPDRVVCRLCQSSHLFRGGKAGRVTPASKSGRSGQQAPDSFQPDATPPRPYSGKEVYAAGDLILHPKFGHGRVLEARSGKISVKFGSSEVRTLLHAG